MRPEQSAALRVSALTHRRLPSVLNSLPRDGSLVLELGGVRRWNSLSVATLVTALASRENKVVVKQDAPRPGESCLAHALFPPGERPQKEVGRSGVPPFDEPWIRRGVAVHPTRTLATTKLPAFRDRIIDLIARASIPANRHTIGAITRLGFEAVTNAEEYGYIDRLGVEAPLRFLAIEHLANPRRPWGPQHLYDAAERYLTAYRQDQLTPQQGWLQLIVADSGCGIAYPGYRVLAEKQEWGRDESDVYTQPVETEVAHVQLALNRRQTTKGKWGRVINRATPPGNGMREITRGLADANAHAGVRTGRTYAHWSNTRANLALTDEKLNPQFATEVDQSFTLVGTVWWMLLPCMTQTELPLDVR